MAGCGNGGYGGVDDWSLLETFSSYPSEAYELLNLILAFDFLEFAPHSTNLKKKFEAKINPNSDLTI